MAYIDRKRKRKWPHIFIHARDGLWHAIQTEPNLRFHFFISPLVIFCGWFFKLSKVEWSVILIAIGMVISLELVNSAIERVTDLVTDDYHILAKQAKDLSSASVLFSACIAVVIGICIFGGHVVQWISHIIK